MAQERNDLEPVRDTEIEDVGADMTGNDDLEFRGDASEGAEGTEETEKIRAQIEETRVGLGETIDAIQEKLSFSNISGQVSEQVNQAVETAKEAVYDATIGKAVNIMKNLGNELSGTSIGTTIRNNPLPFILIGAGAGMLAYNAYSGDKRGGRSRSRSLANRPDRQIGDGSEGTEAGRLSSVTGAISGVKGTVSNAAGSAYETVTGAVDQVYNKAGEYGTTARQQYDHYLEENPLAVGAVALALGAAVGMAIPATRYEGQLMGQARQDLLNKAQDTASSLLHETRQSVGEAGQSFADNVSGT
jgi:hypothetical protein